MTENSFNGARRDFLSVGAAGLAGALAATLSTPTAAHAAADGVSSVNGKTGDVVLTAADVGAVASSHLDVALIAATPDRFPGLDPTGQVECADAMQAALNAVPAGGVVFIPPGRYRMGKALQAPANITISAPHGQAVLVRDGHDQIQLRAYGSHGAPVQVTEGPAREQLTSYGTQIEVTRMVTATPQPWAPGDLVKIYADDEIPGGRTKVGATSFPRIGEYMQVHSASGTTVYLVGRPFEEYRTNIRAARMDDKTISIEGLAFDVSDAAYAAKKAPECTIRCDSMRAPQLTRVRVHRSVGIGIQMRSCVGYRIDGAEVGEAINDPDNGIFGYGIHDVASNGGLVIGGTARFVRHGYTDKSTEVAANSQYPSFYGRTLWTTVMGMQVVHASSSAFDTHQESYGVHFHSCTARATTGIGFAVRGSAHRLSDCVVYGGSVGLKVFTEVGGGVGTGETRAIQVNNFRTEDTTVALQTSIRESSHVRQGVQDSEQTLTVNGIVARGASRFATLTNSRVRIRNFEAIARDLPMFVFLQNTNSRLELEGGVFDFEAVTRTENNRNRILRSTATTTEPYSLIYIRSLRVKASAYYASQCAIGPFETDARTDIDAFVDLESVFPVMPGPVSDTDRCTFGWRTFVVNDSSRVSLSSSASVTLTNSALTDSTASVSRAPDDNLLLVASLPDGVSRVLGKLGKARRIGQRLSILVANASAGATLTVRSGSVYGVSLNGGVTNIKLSPGGQLHLMWVGTSWRQLAV